MVRKRILTLNSIFVFFVYIYIVLLPIGTGLSGIIGNVSLMNYIAVIISVLGIMIIIFKKSVFIRKPIIPTVLYFAYTVSSYLWTTNVGFTWYVGTNLVNGILFIMLTCYQWNDYEVDRFNICFVISQIIVYGVVIKNISSMFSYRLSITVVSSIGIGDFAVGLCLLIAFWMQLVSKSQQIIIRVVSVLAILSNLVIILMAGSRGALVMMLVMIAAWIFFGENKKKTKIVLIISVIVIYFIITNVFIQYLPAAIQNRMTMQAVITTRGSGRFNIWSLAIERFKDSNIVRGAFGYGFNSFLHEISYGSYGGNHDLMAHNVILQTLIEGGVVGLVILFNMGIRQLKDAWKRHDTMLLLALIGLFIAGLSNDMQVTRIWGMILALNYIKDGAYYHINNNRVINES